MPPKPWPEIHGKRPNLQQFKHGQREQSLTTTAQNNPSSQHCLYQQQLGSMKELGRGCALCLLAVRRNKTSQQAAMNQWLAQFPVRVQNRLSHILAMELVKSSLGGNHHGTAWELDTKKEDRRHDLLAGVPPFILRVLQHQPPKFLQRVSVICGSLSSLQNPNPARQNPLTQLLQWLLRLIEDKQENKTTAQATAELQVGKLHRGFCAVTLRSVNLLLRT